MLNMNDVRTEQRIAQERYQVIVLARQQARARARKGEAHPALYRRALSRLAKRVSRPAANYNTTREQTV